MEAPKDIETVKSRTSSKWIGHDGIFRIRFYKISDLNVADAMTDLGIMKQIAGGNTYPIILDLRDVRKVNQKTQIYLSKIENYPSISKIAFLVHTNLLQKLTGKVPQYFQVSDIETMCFTNEEDALEWIA